MDDANSERLSGIKKAAVIIVALGEDLAAKVYKYLSQDDIASISEEIAKTKSVDSVVASPILKEFHNLIRANLYVKEGGYEYARDLILKTLPDKEAKSVIARIEKTLKYGNSFDFLSKIGANELIKFLKDEHPQTIAVVLANMKSKQSAEILSQFDAKLQDTVMMRMASTENVSLEVLKKVSDILKERLKNVPISAGIEIGGVKNVAEIFNNMNRDNSKKILESISQTNEALAIQIRDLMFVFDDIVKLDDKSIQEMLKRVDKKNLTIALKAATDEIKEKIFANMTTRAAGVLKEEMDYLGPVKVKDVMVAQHSIVEEIRTMDEEGIISISTNSEEDAYIS